MKKKWTIIHKTKKMQVPFTDPSPPVEISFSTNYFQFIECKNLIKHIYTSPGMSQKQIISVEVQIYDIFLVLNAFML